MMSQKPKYVKLDEKTAELLDDCYANGKKIEHVIRQDTVLYKDFLLLEDAIQNMEIRADDVWVCSFTRSGTTWIQEMLWCILNDVNLDAAKEKINRRIPFLELSMYGTRESQKEAMAEILGPQKFNYPISMDSVSYAQSVSSPRVIKTHLPFKLLPEKLRKNTSTKIVYVARNSRDVCVSNYYFHKFFLRYQTDFDKFCDCFLHGAVPYGPYWNHLLGYWEERNNRNMLICTFEEMKKDLRSVIRKMSAFLGKTLTDQQVNELHDHLSFDSMKSNTAVNLENETKNRLGKPDLTLDESFIRRGELGQWKEEMSASWSDRFVQMDEEYLQDRFNFSS